MSSIWRTSRRRVSILIAVMLCLSVAACGGSGANAQDDSDTITLRLAAYHPENILLGQAIQLWAREIKSRTNGRVTFDYSWSGSLVKQSETVSALASGLADVANVPVGAFRDQFPLTSGAELLYQTNSPYASAAALRDLANTFEPFRDEWASQGLRFMTSVPIQPSLIASTENLIKSQKDLAGERIRAFGYLSEAMAALGATPVKMPAGQMYDALNRGLIEGATGFPLDAVEGLAIHEVAPFMTDPHMGVYAVTALAMNRETWNELPGDVKATIREVNNDFPRLWVPLAEEYNKRTIENLRSEGAKFYSLPPAETERWREIVDPRSTYVRWIRQRQQQGLPAKEFLTRYQRLTAKYEKQNLFQPVL